MPIATRTFRVFVSSTFEDLKEERNVLPREVWPKLRALCEQHGARFQAIDLRWGVRDEAALDQKTMDICLREIERCQATGVRPNFIALLGDRYGWQPLPSRIPAAEFDPRPIAGDWYKLDENAVPAEYVLQPRTGIFTNQDIWGVLEHELRVRLEAGAHTAGVEGNALKKYALSATHQEIVAGLGDTDEDRRHVFGFCRTPSADSDPRLAEVMAQLPNIVGFDAGDTVRLCRAIYTRMAEVIEREVSRFNDRPVLDVEVEAHDQFAAERTRVFRGRQRELEAIADYVRSDERRPLIVYGESGSGKSAIIARVSVDIPGIRRFAGATAEASNGLSLLRSLCGEIGERYGQIGKLPNTFEELAAVFQNRIRLATADAPLILYIDGLDQLDAHHLAAPWAWLPDELPPHCRIVVSTTKAPAAMSGARLVPVAPFTKEEAGEALDLWLADAGRTLQEDQRKKVLRSSDLPLHLRLAFEEARLWRSFDPIDRCVLGDGNSGVIGQFVARLSAPHNHGGVLVGHALGYLTASRYGVTEDEMLCLFSTNDAVWKDFEKTRRHELEGQQRSLPTVIWSRLFYDLEPYLSQRPVPGGDVLTFYHRSIAEWVGRHAGAPGGSSRDESQNSLVSYFKGPAASRERKLDELPWLLKELARWDELRDFLIDPPNFRALFANERRRWDLQTYWTAVESKHEPRKEYRIAVEFYASNHSELDTAAFQHELGEFFLERGEDPEAVSFLEPAYELRSRLLGEENAASLTSGNRLALALEHLGRFGRATELYTKLLAVSERVYGAESEVALQALHDRAGILYAQGDAEAVPLLERALAGRRRVLGEFADGTLATQLNLGLACFSASDPRAEPLLADLLRVRERVSGTDHPATSEVLEALGTVKAGRHSHQDAESYFRRALEIAEARLGPSHPHTLRDIVNLGMCLVEQERKEEAKSLWLDAYKRMRLATGGNLLYLQINKFRSNLLTLLTQAEDLKTAVPIIVDELTEIDRLLDHAKDPDYWVVQPHRPEGPDPKDSYDRALWVADQLMQKDAPAAEEFLHSVLTFAERAFKEQGDYVSAACNLLGILTKRRGSLGDAEEYNRRAFRTAVAQHGLGEVAQAAHNNLMWVQKRLLMARPVRATRCGRLRLMKEIEAHQGSILSLAYSPECATVLSGGMDSVLKLRRRDSLEVIHEFHGHEGGISGVAFAAEGKAAVSGAWDRTIRHWNLMGGTPLPFVQQCPSDVCAVAAAAEKPRVVFALENGLIGVWDSPFRDGARLLGQHLNTAMAVAISRSGSLVASGAHDNTLKVWNKNGGFTFKGQESHVLTCGISSNSEFLFCGGENGQIIVWSLTSSEMVQVLSGHAGGVCGVAASEDFRWLASASWDKTVRIWEIETGACVSAFETRDQVWTIASGPDFDTILGGDKAGFIYQLRFEEDRA